MSWGKKCNCVTLKCKKFHLQFNVGNFHFTLSYWNYLDWKHEREKIVGFLWKWKKSIKIHQVKTSLGSEDKLPTNVCSSHKKSISCCVKFETKKYFFSYARAEGHKIMNNLKILLTLGSSRNFSCWCTLVISHMGSSTTAQLNPSL